jgi:hypothetical protein
LGSFGCSSFFQKIGCPQIVEMDADREFVDVGVRIGAGSSLSVEEHREQGSPLSCAQNNGLTPGSSEAPTPEMPLCGSPADSDVGVRAMEYRIHHNLKKDSFSVVEGMRILPVEKSSMRIPLCRLIHMPLVRPTFRSDITKLMSAFQFGYRAGSATFYVSTTNESGDNRFVSTKDRREWGDLWNAKNDKFESFLRKDKDLTSLSGCMFFVYDGNHRLLAWKECIETDHKDDALWYEKHGCPECVILDTTGGRGDVLNAMHDINK